MHEIDQNNIRSWNDTTTFEFMIWIDQIIYMSIIRLNRINEYWIKNDEWFAHCIMRFRKFKRFENLKSFFHILSFSRIKQSMCRFYEKMKFIISMIQYNFRIYCTFVTFVAIDEIMMRFTKRNKHIVMIRKKSCSVNFNVLVLCETNYCYVFVFSSSKIEFVNVSECFEKIFISKRNITFLFAMTYANI